jgi:hypothetical protein
VKFAVDVFDEQVARLLFTLRRLLEKLRNIAHVIYHAGFPAEGGRNKERKK